MERPLLKNVYHTGISELGSARLSSARLGSQSARLSSAQLGSVHSKLGSARPRTDSSCFGGQKLFLVGFEKLFWTREADLLQDFLGPCPSFFSDEIALYLLLQNLGYTSKLGLKNLDVELRETYK